MVLVAKGRCPKHERSANRAYEQRRGSAHSRGYGADWRAKRERVLDAEPLCRSCAREGRTAAAVDIDHIVPKHDGGTDDLSNLQPLCHDCHSAKTTREGRFGRRQG